MAAQADGLGWQLMRTFLFGRTPYRFLFSAAQHQSGSGGRFVRRRRRGQMMLTYFLGLHFYGMRCGASGNRRINRGISAIRLRVKITPDDGVQI